MNKRGRKKKNPSTPYVPRKKPASHQNEVQNKMFDSNESIEMMRNAVETKTNHNDTPIPIPTLHSHRLFQRKKTSARLPNGRLPLVEPVQPRSTKPRYQPEKQDDSLLFANEMSHTWGKTLDNRIACSTPIQESCEQIFNFSKNVSPIAIYRDEVDKQASLNISILTNLQSSRSFDPLPATKFEPLTSDSHHSKSEALAVPDELGEENNGYSNDAKQVHKAQVNYPICPLTTYAFSYQKPARLLFRRIERNVAAKCSHEFPKCPLAAFDFLPENKR